MERFMHPVKRGKGLEKVSIHLGSSQLRQRGFGLTEVMISMALLMAVMGTIFVGVKQSTHRSTRTMRSTKLNFETTKALARLEQEITNIVIMRADDPTAKTTVIGNLNESEQHPESDPRDFIPYGLVPLPGYRAQDLQGLPDSPNPTDLTPRDSRYYRDSSAPGVSDAIRLVSLKNESVSLRLAFEDPTSGTYYDTAQDEVNNHIILKANQGLEVGDFAVIQDRETSDLFRVTAINPGPHTGEVEIRHDQSLSIWNLPFNRNYGNDGPGPVYIREVSVLTYAHDPDRGILYRKDHMFDDGFNPVDQSWGNGEAGINTSWLPVVLDLTEFVVEYALDNGPSTRTPAAAPYGVKADEEPLNPRGNEIGRPHLDRIQLKMKQMGAKVEGKEREPQTIDREMNPLNLLGARGGVINPGARNADCFVLYEGERVELEPEDNCEFTRSEDDDDDDEGGGGEDDGDDEDDGGNDFGPPGSGGGGL